MKVYRKNRIIETTIPGVSMIIRATPSDSDPKIQKKNFFIVDLVMREDIGAADYRTEPRCLEAKEMRKLLGLPKNENVTAY